MGTSRHRKLAVLFVGAAALTFSPVAVPNWSGDLSGIAGAEAKEGRGGGGDRGGGNGRGGGSENRGGGKDRSDHGGRGGGKAEAEQGGPAKSWQFWRKEERKPVKPARAPATKPAKPAKAVPLPVARTAPEEPPAPRAKPEKPLAAKLGGLNSLKRNPTAILNSADPRMAAFREILLADEALKAADQAVQEAIDGWKEGATVEEVEARIAELEGMNALTAEEDAELQQLKEIAALADEAEKAQEDLADAVSDEALTEALLAGANPNKVAAYGGEEAYVDQEMLDWTRETLGLSEPEVAVDPDPEPDPEVADEPDTESEPDPDVADETDPDSGSDPEPEVAGEPEPDPILEPEPAG